MIFPLPMRIWCHSYVSSQPYDPRAYLPLRSSTRLACAPTEVAVLGSSAEIHPSPLYKYYILYSKAYFPFCLRTYSSIVPVFDCKVVLCMWKEAE